MLEGVKQRNDIVYEKREIQNRWNELIRGLSDSEEDWIYQSRQSNLNRQGDHSFEHEGAKRDRVPYEQHDGGAGKPRGRAWSRSRWPAFR